MKWKTQFFSLLAVLFFANASCQVADTNAISNEQFKQIAAGKNVVILDVRTTEEFSQGHIPKAIHNDVLQEQTFRQYISSLPKDKTYLLYCRSGKRSANALHIMNENGFAQVKHLRNGIVGWDGEIEK